jgi:hypothetical protein
MSQVAVCNISDNVVINVILADPNDIPYEGTYLVEINETTNIGGIGYIYNKDKQKFIGPQPFDSWIFDTDTCLWVAPVTSPTNIHDYYWDEPSLSWVAYNG